MKSSLYKSEIGKREIFELYDQKLSSLAIDYQSKTLDTSFGKTHVLITGNEKAPPLMILHGSNGCAPIGLETYPELSKAFRVFAVDVLAQPNKSAETRLSMKDNSYGEWVNEVIDQLHIKDVILTGFSFGGLLILKTLLQDESNIKEVFLAAPAFIVNGNPLIALFKVFIPMKRFMKTKKRSFLVKFLEELFTDKDEFAHQYLSKVFLYFDMDFTPVPVIKASEAQQITTPIHLIAAQKDIMFPGKKMIQRAKKIFPSLKNSILLEDSKHVQGKNHNSMIEQLILESINKQS
ncbi:MAG: enantioselective carboxylesterase CesB [Saprospiraceae bacterium]